MKLSRVSIETLAAIYRADRGIFNKGEIKSISQRTLSQIPNSKGLEFGEFLDLCKQTLDVYEEGEHD